jgi:hypothetical protein
MLRQYPGDHFMNRFLLVAAVLIALMSLGCTTSAQSTLSFHYFLSGIFEAEVPASGTFEITIVAHDDLEYNLEVWVEEGLEVWIELPYDYAGVDHCFNEDAYEVYSISCEEENSYILEDETVVITLENLSSDTLAGYMVISQEPF